MSVAPGAYCYQWKLTLNKTAQAKQPVPGVPVHYAQHLFANVLSPAQGTRLDEVLIAPRVREFVVLPGVVHGQQGEVIPFSLVEFGFLLICESLFILKISGTARSLSSSSVRELRHPALLPC